VKWKTHSEQDADPPGTPDATMRQTQIEIRADSMSEVWHGQMRETQDATQRRNAEVNPSRTCTQVLR
jgi:hypothetical protein